MNKDKQNWLGHQLTTFPVLKNVIECILKGKKEKKIDEYNVLTVFVELEKRERVKLG